MVDPIGCLSELDDDFVEIQVLPEQLESARSQFSGCAGIDTWLTARIPGWKRSQFLWIVDAHLAIRAASIFANGVTRVELLAVLVVLDGLR